MNVGDRVYISAPDNGFVHGCVAVVVEPKEWGAVVRRPNGLLYRALHEELAPLRCSPTGDVCDTCGGLNMRSAGTCKVCEDCGTSTGC